MLEPFAWLPPDLASRLCETLAAPMPRGRGELVFTDPPAHLDAAVVDGRRHIVFLGYYPYVSTVKKSLALRASGRYFTTLICLCAREDQAPERFFDQVFEAPDYAALLPLLRFASPTALSVHIPHHILAALAFEARLAIPDNSPLFARPAYPVILDVYDAQYFMHRDAAHPETRLERELLCRADAVVHKMPPEALAVLRRVHGFTAPDVLVHSLPCRDFFAPPAAPPPGPPFGLAYAGGVMPRHIALTAGHENQILDPLIVGIAGNAGASAGACAGDSSDNDADIDADNHADSGADKGAVSRADTFGHCAVSGPLRLTIYANQNARDMHFEEHAFYLDMARRLPGFSLRPGLPFFALPAALAAAAPPAHFGLLFDNVEMSSYRAEAFHYNMSTKIFSYLEAGLPLLVYEEFHYIADLVRENNLGLIYDRRRLDQLPALLAAADYPSLRAAVLDWREGNQVPDNLPALEHLYLREASPWPR